MNVCVCVCMGMHHSGGEAPDQGQLDKATQKELMTRQLTAHVLTARREEADAVMRHVLGE